MTDERCNRRNGFQTRAIHHGYDPREMMGSVAPPVFMTSTDAFESVADSAAVMAQQKPGYLYGRERNPTQDLLERRLADLEGAAACVVFASGMAAISSLTLIVLAVIYRPLVAECYDPGFLRVAGGGGPIYHIVFLVLVVLNLVAGFQALGTLMAVGLMMLPAAAARLWSSQVAGLAVTASAIAFGSGALGLLVSYHFNMPSGPAIVLMAGLAYLVSILFGSKGGIARPYFRRPHFHDPKEIKR